MPVVTKLVFSSFCTPALQFLSLIHIYEKNGRVIEVAECNRGGYRSFLRDDAIPVPDDVEFVWLRTKVLEASTLN